MSFSEGTIFRVVATMLFPEDAVLQNVFHLVLTSAVGDTEPDDVIEDFEEYIADLYATIADQVLNSITSPGIQVYEYDSVDDDWDEVGVGAFAFPSRTTGDMLPHGVAALINLYTTDPDTQGKKYLGGFKEVQQDDGSWVAGCIVDMLLFAGQMTDLFTATITSNVYTPGVWSPTYTVFKAFNGSYAANTLPAYQRRRKPGVGV